MEFFTYENVKELVVYSCFGGIIGYNIFWIGYGAVLGVKWVIKKLKRRFGKNKEETVNE